MRQFHLPFPPFLFIIGTTCVGSTRTYTQGSARAVLRIVNSCMQGAVARVHCRSPYIPRASVTSVYNLNTSTRTHARVPNFEMSQLWMVDGLSVCTLCVDTPSLSPCCQA
jgi:hypothetical protein